MITDLEEETGDLDWFCVDSKGEIAHFASGGRGFLPPSVRRSKEALQQLTLFFRNAVMKRDSGAPSANLSLHIQFHTESEKAAYLSDYLLMASKGLYSYDCVVERKRPSGYFLVAVPTSCLRREELPDDVRDLLAKTVFHGEFSAADLVDEGEVT